MRNRRIEMREHRDFAETLGKKSIVAIGIGPECDAILLAVDPIHVSTVFGRQRHSGIVEFPNSIAEHPYPTTIVHAKKSSITITDVTQVDLAFPKIQPLHDNHTLIVSTRCRNRNDVPEQNAVIYDEDGMLVRRMVFGDGIADVQVSHDQRIWVSYFDEGVFGNYGWNYPMGSDGLLCFAIDGQITYCFCAPQGFGPIDDCYALNVARDAAWLCYYSDFPIVKVNDEGVQGWKNEFDGPRALAVDRQRALLWGGYKEDRNRCILQTISSDTLTAQETLDLHLPTGDSLDNARVFGRDSIIHAFIGSAWYQFDLRLLPD